MWPSITPLFCPAISYAQLQKILGKALVPSFQITLLALCRECSVYSGPLQLGDSRRLYRALLGQTLAARLISAQLRSLVKIQ